MHGKGSAVAVPGDCEPEDDVSSSLRLMCRRGRVRYGRCVFSDHPYDMQRGGVRRTHHRPPRRGRAWTAQWSDKMLFTRHWVGLGGARLASLEWRSVLSLSAPPTRSSRRAGLSPLLTAGPQRALRMKLHVLASLVAYRLREPVGRPGSSRPRRRHSPETRRRANARVSRITYAAIVVASGATAVIGFVVAKPGKSSAATTNGSEPTSTLPPVHATTPTTWENLNGNVNTDVRGRHRG